MGGWRARGEVGWRWEGKVGGGKGEGRSEMEGEWWEGVGKGSTC